MGALAKITANSVIDRIQRMHGRLASGTRECESLGMTTPPVNSNRLPPVDGTLARLGRVLLPPRCLICGEAGSAGHDLCTACIAALPWNDHACARCGLPVPAVDEDSNAAGMRVCGRCLRKPPPLDRVIAAFRYEFPITELLPRLKFHQDLAAGREVAMAMQAQISHCLDSTEPRPQALIPVPLHPTRLRQRGYNQALELARPLAQAFAIALLADGLRRMRATPAQSELGALARRRNPRGAFAVGDTRLPEHVALVDDVMTTGATVFECARVLRRVGVQRVDVWVAARVPTRTKA